MNRFRNVQQIAPYFNSITKYEKKPHVYILQEREFIRIKEPTYKIGQTEDIHVRFGSYSKQSDLKYIMPVKNCRIVESIAKLRFKVIFKHRPDYGAEYYEGDLSLMIIEMNRIITQCLLTDNVKPLIFLRRIFKPLPVIPVELPVIPVKQFNFNFSKKLPALPQICEPQNIAKVPLTSKQCHKCRRVFARSSVVTKHLQKSIPCDLKCKICNVKLISKNLYTQHVAEHDDSAKLPSKQKVKYPWRAMMQNLTILDTQIIVPIPIQDFQLKIDDVNPEHILRMKCAKEALSKDTFNVISSLLDLKDINMVARDLFYDVLHSNDSKLHNICLSDVSRGTVRMLYRIPQTDKVYWAALKKDTAMRAINEYLKSIFIFVLESGFSSLEFATCHRNSESFPCLALKGENNSSKILYANENRFCLSYAQTDELVVSQNYCDSLMQYAEKRKNDVIVLLQDMIIDEISIKKWLEDNRQQCHTTMNNTKSLPDVYYPVTFAPAPF